MDQKKRNPHWTCFGSGVDSPDGPKPFQVTDCLKGTATHPRKPRLWAASGSIQHSAFRFAVDSPIWHSFFLQRGLGDISLPFTSQNPHIHNPCCFRRSVGLDKRGNGRKNLHNLFWQFYAISIRKAMVISEKWRQINGLDRKRVSEPIIPEQSMVHEPVSFPQ